MNKIDFTQPGGFPLDSNALDFLQSAFATSINALSALGGSSNYIVSGCVPVGSNTSQGWMVIDGELLPFQGGITQTKVIVRETKAPVRFQDLINRDVIVTRYVGFGSGTGEILVSSLGTIKNLLTVKSELASIQDALALIVSVPSGIIVAWHGALNAIPAGWHLCDGSAAGIPDLRAKFIYGSNGADVIGATGGAQAVTLTIDQIPSHTHQMTLAENGAGSDHQYPAITDNHNVIKETGPTEATGGGQSHNNMPPYMVLAYIVKL
jgi:microcystin-dependent protein